FDILVAPKRTKTFKWVVDVNNAALEDLRSSIIAMHHLRNGKKCFRKVYDFYGLGEEDEPQLTALPPLDCGCAKLEGEKAESIIKHIMFNLNLRHKYMPTGNEASKDKLEIRVEKQISGPNGHGPVDFALVSQTSEVICVIEVKAKDFLQGIAQNTVQCEAALMKCRKNVLGIIIDSEKWYFLKCSLDSEEKPNFSLSRPLVVVYGDDDMEKRVKEVLGHIVWLLNDFQNKFGAV
ncbi:5158_t:CDS:2, partial [Racocetra persica]